MSEVLQFVEKRLCSGKVSLIRNKPDGGLDITEVTDLAVVVVRTPRSSVIKLLAPWIAAIDREGKETTCFGLVLTIPKNYSGRSPAILTGLEASSDGTVLPPGCTASFLDDYNGPVTDLRSPDAFVLALAFPPNVASSDIESILVTQPSN